MRARSPIVNPASAPSGAIAASLALVVAVAGPAIAISTVGQVSVIYDADPIRCEGSNVGPYTSSPDEEFVYTAAELTPGMRCELRIHVINDGWRDVEVRTVGLPLLGLGNTLKIDVPFVNPNGQTKLPGGAEYFECSAVQVPSPWVAVSALGGLFTRTDGPPIQSQIWFHKGPLTGCVPD